MMNLIKFINEVDEIVKKYDKEKLLQIIHEVARTLPESSRNDFIQMIKNVEKSGKVSSKQKNQSLFKQQYEHWSGILHALEEGEKCLLEEYNEEYDDWYNSSVDEILYEDPDEIGEDLDGVCKFIHTCTDAEEYQYAMEIGRRFFALAIQTDGEYGGAYVELHEMKHNGFLHADLRQVVMDTMYASYMYEKPDEVPDALYEIFSNAEITADIKDLKLQNLMQYADADLKDFDVFLKDWINYLGAIPGRLAEQLYTEALELTNDIDTKIENAQKFVHTHPGLYKKLLEDGELNPKKALEVGADGVKRISDKLIIRSEVALKTAEYAITVNADRSLIEKYYVEAFRSDTNAVNYLRAFLNSANQDICRQELKEIHSAYIRRGGRYSGYYDYGSMRVNELAENEPGKNMVYVLRLLGGEFMEVLRLGVSEKNALGWSATFMKQGLAFFLFYLSDGKNLGKGISQMAKITRYVFGFDIATYSKGQKKIVAKDEMSFFTDIFMKWKKETEIGESDREKILRHIEKQMEKRVAGIMDANRRKYYGECASYIAAIGEIREYLGERGGKQMFMSRYAAEYPRRSAFRTELQNYGWEKRRK